MWDKRPDMVVHESDPFNAEAPPSALGSAVTDLDAFYVRNHGPVPDADPAWRVVVGGLVARSLDLDLADLRSRPQRTVTATLQCAGNRREGLLRVRDIPGEAPWGPGATSTAAWGGVPLADLLGEAGVQPGAAHVAFDAPDVSDLAEPPQPFGGSVPLAVALGPDVLLALTMNGQPLPQVHGGPVRVVVPGHIGARSVKWVRSVTVQREPSGNYFQQTAYRLLPPGVEPAPGVGMSLSEVAQNCAILAPSAGEQVPAGALRVAGYAVAGAGRRVARVDVSGDDGTTWVQADLEEAPGTAWRHWSATVTVSPGDAVLVARCWDSTGALQPESASAVWNTKGYVNNSWDRVPVAVQP